MADVTSNSPTCPALLGNRAMFQLLDGLAFMAGSALALAAPLVIWDIFELVTYSRPYSMQSGAFPNETLLQSLEYRAT